MIICSLYANPIHIGHLEYLRESSVLRSFSELFVIVNSDKQAVRKSGYSFIDEQTRIAIIRDLKYVDLAMISVSEDESVAVDLEKYGNRGDIFVNSGDRDESNWNPKEVEVCKRKGIEMVYLRLPKVNSSSKILDDYYKWRFEKELASEYEIMNRLWKNEPKKELYYDG